MPEDSLSTDGMLDGWQSLAPIRQTISLRAHLHDTNLNLELFAGTTKQELARMSLAHGT